ncbi:type 1 glutamine amidotransferase [Psychromonas sp. PT13]|uniref:type 1 glutamine amidotransferase n=1 Tax=Psychromonas sp. PT13 TaxID=3439547 RepID=UPI003EB85933
MKIGILLCGNVPHTLIDQFGDYASCLQRKLHLKRYGDVSTWNVFEKSELPKNDDECDVYIIGGSPVGVNDDVDWIDSLSRFIRNAFYNGKKLFGICFGHQIIHHALGGAVDRSYFGWGVGAYSVTFSQDFNQVKMGKTMSLLSMHQDQVVKPAHGFNVVAGNDFCPNYMTRFKKQVLTIQGHPEFHFHFFLALLNQRKDILSQQESNVHSEEGNSAKDSDDFIRIMNQFLFER